MKTTNILETIQNLAPPILMLLACAVCIGYALIRGAGGIQKLLKKQPIHFNVKTAATTFCALALAGITALSATAMWPTTPSEALTNAEGDNEFSFEEPDVRMGVGKYSTNALLDEFLKEGFGDDYDAIWNGNTAAEFMCTNDESKIKANEACLLSLGLKETGFRNGVVYPTDVLTADVIKTLSSMTEEEKADIFNQHRWMDVYRRIITNPGFCAMVAEDLEYYDEFVEQNSGWYPSFKALLESAKNSEAGIYSLLVQEQDGTEHYSDLYRYGAAKICAVLQNAIIRGITMDTKSVVNWELPSMSPDINTRWTHKLTEEEDQENKPASIWAFPNTKSGQDAYTDGFNLADLRMEKFDPEKTTPSVNNPGGTPTDTPTPPSTPSHTVYTYYRLLGTKTNVAQYTTQTVKENQDWKTSKKDLSGSGYIYDSNNFGTSNGVVTGVMGTKDVVVIFYYTAKPTETKTVYVDLIVEHVDAYTGKVIGNNKSTDTFVEGTQQTVSKKSINDYVYAGYYTINDGKETSGNSTTVTLNQSTTVRFYYDQLWTLTTKFVDIDTKKEIEGRAYDDYTGDSQYTAYGRDIDGYERVGNSENNSNPQTLTGTMPHSDKEITFYYKKVEANFTVTACYKAIDSNHDIITPIPQTKKAGEWYDTEKKDFNGYRFHHVTGTPSGTMPNHDVTVTYWYELIKQDGDGKKDPDAGPGNNGTGNATEGIGPGHGTEDPYIPSTIVDTPTQKGDEPTANHLPTDNPGGQGAGSEYRQEVGNNTVSGIIGDNETTQSSGNGGQDPGHVDTGATEVEGGGYTPPDKTTPAEANPSTSTTTTTTTTPNGDGTSTTTTTTTTTDISGTSHSGTLDWEP